MSKKIPNQLYELIHALSLKEKKFFRNYAKRHVLNGENQYLRLFEIIDKQEIDDVKQVNEKAKSQIQNLPVIKNQLYNQLLDCLRLYHAKKSGKIRFYQCAIEVHLLYEKGLIIQAQKRIKKAKKLAETYQLNLAFLQISLIERRLLRKGKEVKNNKRILMDLQSIYDDYLNNIRSEFELLKLNESEWIGVEQDKPIQTTKDQRQPAAKSPVLLNDIEKLFFTGKVYYYMFKQAHYKKKQDREKGLECLEKILTLFEEQTALLQSEYDYQFRYIGFLRNYFNSCFKLGYLEKFDTIIGKIDGIKTDNTQLKAEAFNVRLYIIMVYYLVQGNYRGVVERASEIEKGLENYKTILSKADLITFKYNLGFAFFGCKEFEASLKHIQSIFEETRTHVREDILLNARFLELLLYLELEKFRLLEYRIAAFRQYIMAYYKKNRPSEKYKYSPKYLVLPILEKMAKEQVVSHLINAVSIDVNSNEDELKIWIKFHQNKC